MNVSVIIPMLNEAEVIERAVASAKNGGACEVICVDGGSHDASCQLAQQAGAMVIAGKRGRAAQQNLGAASAKGDVLLFLHADNWLAPAAIQQLDAARDHGCQLGGFRQRIEADGPLYRMLEQGNALRLATLGNAYGDQAIFIDRRLFERLGGFPNMAIMEDLHLLRRARKLARPWLLPGPLYVSARRWQQQGVVRQTARNWCFLIADRLGVSPATLARHYAPHQN